MLRGADPMVLKCCSTAGWGGVARSRMPGTLVVTEWPVLNGKRPVVACLSEGFVLCRGSKKPCARFQLPSGDRPS